MLGAILTISSGANQVVAKSPRGKTFRAGAFAIDITPRKLPVIVNGSVRERKSSTITDRLHARCLVLDDGSTRIAFAIVDNCVVPGPLMDKAKAAAHQTTAIPTDHILISATHAHSTPSVLSVLDIPRFSFVFRSKPRERLPSMTVAHVRSLRADSHELASWVNQFRS